jgi:hypothetical protein
MTFHDHFGKRMAMVDNANGQLCPFEGRFGISIRSGGQMIDQDYPPPLIKKLPRFHSLF